MIDVTSEDTMRLADLRLLLPKGRNGSRPHISTVLRWILDGVAGPGGQRVRLRAVRLSGKWVSSRQALQEFCEALTPVLGDAPASPPRTPAQRGRASEKASRRLEQAGI
jgi:hypothetical protein